MKKKMLVMDLDGTLLDSDKRITVGTKAAIRRLQQAGHIVTLASGRPLPGMKSTVAELELEQYGGYVLAYNGARIMDWKHQEVLFQKTFEHQYLQELYAAALRHRLTILTYIDDYAIAGTDVNVYAEFEIRINGLQLKRVQDFVSYVDFPIIKCLMTGEPEQIAVCEQELLKLYGDKLGIFKSEDFFLEIAAQNINKGTSVEWLVHHLGMNREDVICCGDGYNDIPMLQYAGVGVAMANAKEVVKQAADVITGSNDKNGLAAVIERYILEAGDGNEAK